MIQKFFKNPIFYVFVIFIAIILLLVFLKYTWCVAEGIIIISMTVISATFGYFVTHFLEIERKKNEEKRILYTKLVLGLKIFMGSGQKTSGEFNKAIIDFEDTYYTSWLYISTAVYKKLIAYMEKYEVWNKDNTDENKTDLNENFLQPLMQAIRDEITFDEKAKFINYILQIKK